MRFLARGFKSLMSAIPSAADDKFSYYILVARPYKFRRFLKTIDPNLVSRDFIFLYPNNQKSFHITSNWWAAKELNLYPFGPGFESGGSCSSASSPKTN